ncbi:mandelate racemase/muconate lactonizing enzyme family protein [Paenibacillus validus]|uniref:Mandelate racemase/muconate lactonizing enzyme family protein n=1 Tax=Paenibacillus validus TaxID=44253 RepID=A0A7X2Z7P4_9BACL|nr:MULTISPECIES: mandelate racemase/muconate lactonizing enzyme family protein [Paenibacillus]MED4601039.1 mandelate racemase/muconate lactonizing enzyme family protein [Paenibacillus validus]MED4604914.1 mandelate racemase/muconate lactonizing enzyme family protein [Paenibacillus validus]MUG69816.1 mandelate racemase/muconate lactonizing enzyme family protein [Paenibacillus validus]
MKVKNIQTYILRTPLGNERFFSSQCSFPERNSLIVKIETDDGIIGWGEGGQYGPPEPVAAVVKHVLSPKLINKELQNPIRIWEQNYADTRDFGQKGTYIEALSAVDIALWDIYGQMLNKPVHHLIGGSFRENVFAYATGCYYRGEDVLNYKDSLPKLAEEARSYVDAGFRILKMKVGLLSIEEDIERVKTIREAIGPNTSLLVDCNHAYNVFTAVKMAKELEKFNVMWLEEPVVPEDRIGYREVRSSTNIPIAGGECEFTRFGFRDLFLGGCVDIAQPDICVSGGFSEWMKIQALASSFGVTVIPHVWGSGIALAAALHVLASIPPSPHTANTVPLQNEPIVEYDRNPNPLRDELLKTPITLQNGKVPVPQNPGLGIEVNLDVISKYGSEF